MRKKLVKKNTTAQGKFTGNEKGFGFVTITDNKNGADIFIPPHFTYGALNGDEVTIKFEERREKSPDSDQLQVGKIKEVRNRLPMVGTFHMEGQQCYVKPVDTKIPHTFLVPPKTVKRFGLADGHRVVFSVDKRLKFKNTPITCFITDILGHTNDPGMDVLTLVYKAGVLHEFSKAVIKEAEDLPAEVGEGDITGRLDLRDEHIITIDGEDTKDIDDAISFEQTPEGNYRLGVHIADVTHYVQENTTLDESALERGTSIYLADRVIPMLPHKLSSGICSLFPGVDRLTLSCLMTIDSTGNVTNYDITPSIIHSKKRWTYQEVEDRIDTDPFFQTMDKLREILREKRERRGTLDINLPEAKIRVDEEGRPISIEQYPRTRATSIIEEFMILCNETIAAHFFYRNIPFVYRTHEPPSAEKLAGLRVIAKNLGVKFTGSSLQKLLAKVQDTPAETAISTAVLQSLPQAHYTPDDPTHYGLASKAYCHFTSPIRRYADLQIHRIIKHSLAKESFPQIINVLHEVCAQCSRTERTADALEREVTDLKKAQFMANKEGQTFDATVSGVTSWGIYTMLSNTVEGLIPIANLRQNGYSFDKNLNVYENKGRDRNKTSAKTLRHGSLLTVRLVRVDEEERKVTFNLNGALAPPLRRAKPDSASFEASASPPLD